MIRRLLHHPLRLVPDPGRRRPARPCRHRRRRDGRRGLPRAALDHRGGARMARPARKASRVTYRRMTWDRVAIVEQRLDSYLDTARPAPHRLAA